MARTKLNAQHIDNSNPTLYLQGRVKDNTGAGDGTPVNEFVYGDFHQTFAKLMALAKITYNNLPDNEQNGYQLIEAIKALASKNDYIIPLTSAGGVLNMPVKISTLQAGESFIVKSAVDKAEETTVKGTLDNTTKAATFFGSFKSGDYVRVISRENSIEFVRLVDSQNLSVVNTELKFLKAATQAIEDTGESEEAATTPKSNKSVFAKRVNGDQSADYLATEQKNGLLSKEDKAILNNIGNSRIRNIGSFSGVDVHGSATGTSYVTAGDVASAVIVEKTGGGEVVEVTFKNAMENQEFKLDISVQSQSASMEVDNDIAVIVWKPMSTTKARIYIEESKGGVQNLKIHIDVIQL